ncbi:hypothetical protein Tco_0102264, partial [Tanacetum coccineum]
MDPSKVAETYYGDRSEKFSRMGLAGYYRRFVEGFSRLALPLTQLMRNNLNMSYTQDENPPQPPPPSTQQTPQKVSTIKLHVLKKGEYDIWAMKLEHYLAHTDYPIWEVIQNGNGPV